MDKVSVYLDSAEEWRWHRKSENGQIVAESGEGYKQATAAMHMAETVNGESCEYKYLKTPDD